MKMSLSMGPSEVSDEIMPLETNRSWAYRCKTVDDGNLSVYERIEGFVSRWFHWV